MKSIVDIFKREYSTVKDSIKITNLNTHIKELGLTGLNQVKAYKKQNLHIMKVNFITIKRMVKEHLFFTFQCNKKDSGKVNKKSLIKYHPTNPNINNESKE